MATPIATYNVQLTPQNTTPLTTASFTPSNGEVLVVKLDTWDTGSPLGAPTGGSQTYTSRVVNAPGGFNQWCAIYTATISGSPGSMTVSSTPGSSLRGSMTVERWPSGSLAGSPVTASSTGTTGNIQGTITPSSATSTISWTGGDVASKDPAGRTYFGSGTEEQVRDDHVGSNGVDYHAYQASVSTSSQTYGVNTTTAGGNMTYVTAAIEILTPASTITKDTVESYRVFNAITKNQAESYRVLNSVTKDTAESYRVLNSVTKNQAESYRVLNSITKDTAESYRVLNSVTKNQAESYRVFNAITKDTVEVYNILSGTAQQKDTVESYRVFNSVTKDQTESYRVLNAVTKNQNETYRVFNAATKDQSETYRVLNSITKDQAEQYNILGGSAQQKDTVERYRIYNSGTKDTVERYRIFNAGTLSLSVWSSALVEIPASAEGLWDGTVVVPCTLELS